MKKPFEFTERIRSFRYAGRGIWLTLRSQHNAWIHVAATIVALIASYLLGISRPEWTTLPADYTEVGDPAWDALNPARVRRKPAVGK